MMVRYSKYLVNDYHAEFEGNLRSWAAGLRLAPPAPERAAAAARARDLQRLYLARVLPDEVLAILNWSSWSTKSLPVQWLQQTLIPRVTG